MDHLPAFFFSTEIVFVDDSIDYLNSLAVNFRNERYTVTTFHQPAIARDYLHSKKKINFLDNIFNTTFPDNVNQHIITQHIDKIHTIRHSSDKYNILSTLIVDYNMHIETGIDFINSLPKNLNVAKILLTGEANEEIATQAFNARLIEFFAKKSDINLITTLKSLLEKLAFKHFQKLSSPLIEFLKISEIRPMAICDDVFIEYFKELINEHNIVEYYLIDSIGSYLLLDGDRNAFILNVQNEDQIKSNNDLLTRAQISKNYMLCYRSLDNNMFPEEEEIEDYLQQATLVEGTNTFYVSLRPILLES